jgi:hypothetical protein
VADPARRLVDPVIGHVDAYVRSEQGWLWLGTWSDADARVPPFDAVALDLSLLWASAGGPIRE